MNETLTKTVTHSMKDLKAPDSRGSFEAYVAQTWPEDTPKKNADTDGDIFLTGAFDEQDGDTVSVFYQHDYAPTSDIGQAVLHPGQSRDVLPATGQLFVGKGKPIAEAVYESMLLPADDPSALREFSVGYSYNAKDVTRRPDGVRVIRKSRVEEISVVYQGAQQTELVSVKHQNAAKYIQSAHDAMVKAGATCSGTDSAYTIVINNPEPTTGTIGEVEVKKAIPSHSTDTYGGAWDGPAEEAKIPNDAGESVLRKMFAWVDPSGDPNVKDSYRFVHHSYANGPGPASTVACSAGIGVLNGGRGGTTIPQADIQGVHAHLAKHLSDANMQAPPLKALKAEEPLPQGEAALLAHLVAALPTGHAESAAAMEKLPPGFLVNVHKRLHASGNAEHSHPGLKSEVEDIRRKLEVLTAGI